MKLTIRRLTPAPWPALADLFGKRGASNRRWCMYGRIARSGEEDQEGAEVAALGNWDSSNRSIR